MFNEVASSLKLHLFGKSMVLSIPRRKLIIFLPKQIKIALKFVVFFLWYLWIIEFIWLLWMKILNRSIMIQLLQRLHPLILLVLHFTCPLILKWHIRPIINSITTIVTDNLVLPLLIILQNQIVIFIIIKNLIVLALINCLNVYRGRFLLNFFSIFNILILQHFDFIDCFT